MSKTEMTVRTVVATFWLAASALLAPTGESQTPGDIMFRPLTGPMKILVIRVNYPNSSGNPVGPELAQAWANQVRVNLEAKSYNRAFPVTVNIAGTPSPLTMPNPTSFYLNAGAARLRADAVATAEANGFPNVEANYDREIIVSTKTWKVAANFATFNQRTVFSSSANALGWFHELGHTNDWQHANLWLVNTPGAHPESAGRQVQYGDPYAPMGGAGTFRHFNPRQAYRANWLQAADVLTVTQPGVYRIRALEQTPNGTPMGLRIARDPGRDYWIYYRTQPSVVQSGVLIRWAYSTNAVHSQLLDMNTSTATLDDAELSADRIFTPLGLSFTVQTLGVNAAAGWADVLISGTLPSPDVLPVIDVTNPARGQTLNGSVTYTATAYDPDLGNTNGAGIFAVVLSLYDNQDKVEGWLRRGAPEPPNVASSGLQSNPASYSLTVPTATLPNGAYYLVVSAYSLTPDGAVNRVWFPHVIDNTD